MGISSSLVNQWLENIRHERIIQIKTLRFVLIINLIMFSPIIILFYFHFNQIRGSESGGQELADSAIESNVTFQTQLDVDDQYRLFWTVDYETQAATLEVRAVLQRPYDWFAVGFSNYGEIVDADMCVLWTDRRHKIHFQDIHTDNNSFVFVDDVSNDCKLLSARKKTKVLRFAFRRDFDTCDPNDYLIEDGTTHIVYATGKGPVSRVDGIRLADHKHGFQRVQLLKRLEVLPKLASITKMIEFVNSEVSVPDTDTTYWCRVHELPKELKDKHHIIQYQAVIQEGNEAL
ncbi:unnamed protein product, partial [Oppiella nova]